MNLFDPFAFTEHRLPNGAPVYTNLSFPLKAVMIGVLIHAGSRDEEAGKEGEAHFMEHLPFRGTVRFPDNKSLTFPIESRGGLLNAWTAEDHIVFLAKIAPEDIELGAEALLGLMTNAKNDEYDFEKERNAIIQEYLDSYAEAGAYAVKTAYSRLFPNHSLGHRMIGELPSLKSLTISDIRNFYNRFCRNGHKTFMVLGGGIGEKAVLEPLGRLFGERNAESTKRRQETVAEISQELRIVVSDQPYSRTGIFTAMHGFHGNDPKNEAAAKVFFAMLGRGTSSPLYYALRESEALVYGYNFVGKIFEDAGILGFKASASFINVWRVCDKFWETVDAVSRDQERFHAAKEMLLKAERMREYTLWHVISEVAGAISVNSPIFTLPEEHSFIEAVTWEDIKLLKERYFTKERSITVVVKGQAE